MSLSATGAGALGIGRLCIMMRTGLGVFLMWTYVTKLLVVKIRMGNVPCIMYKDEKC